VIAQAQARAGNLPGALETIGSLPPEEPPGSCCVSRNAAMASIAYERAHSGDIQSVLTLAASSADGQFMELAWERVARAREDAGDLSGALQAIAGMRDTLTKAATVRRYVTRLARSEDLPRIMELATGIEYAPVKASALAAVAEGQAKFGDCAGAAETLSRALAAWKSHWEGWLGEGPIYDIVVAQTETGDLSGALATAAETVEAIGARLGALERIAWTQVAANDVPAALQTASKLPDSPRRGGTLRHMAKLEAQAGDAASALSWASTRGSPRLEAAALLGIAEGLIERARPPAQPSVADASNVQRLAIEHCYRR